MRLERASLTPPDGLIEMYTELGSGENGYQSGLLGENDVIAGKTALEDHLRKLIGHAEGRNLRPGWIPMTTYWLLDDFGTVAGVGRLRHTLTAELLNDGGHIGYYVRPGFRGKGCGTAILEKLLPEARNLGLERVLLTVRVGNTPSIRIIEGRGGVLEDERTDLETGIPYLRYWIDLT